MQKHLLLIAVLASTSALAQRISVLPFTGDKSGATARTQLVSALCDSAECVNAATLITKNRADPKKLKKNNMDAVVLGSVTVKKKVKTLTIEVLNGAGTSKGKKAYPLEASGLSQKNIQAVVAQVQKVAPAKEAAAPVAPPPEDKPAAKPAEPPPAAKPAPVAETKPSRPSDDMRDDGETKPEEPAPAAKKSKDSFLVLDVGADLLTRKFEYVNVVTPNLRRYDLPFFPSIAARAEFYPFAISGKSGALGGLGVEAGISTAPYLKSRKASEMDPYPTSMTRFDAGLRFRIIPSKDLGLAITPYAGLRLHSFTVGANAAGTRLDGLPNIAETGLRLGAQLDFTVLDGALSFFGRFSVIPTFSQGEIVSAAFFSGGGSSFGIDAGVGVGVRIVGPLSVRASFEYNSYALKFKTTETDTYVAEGANDQYLGANIGLRLSF